MDARPDPSGVFIHLQVFGTIRPAPASREAVVATVQRALDDALGPGVTKIHVEDFAPVYLGEADTPGLG
jgi:hypothetical protein